MLTFLLRLLVLLAAALLVIMHAAGAHLPSLWWLALPMLAALALAGLLDHRP